MKSHRKRFALIALLTLLGLSLAVLANIYLSMDWAGAPDENMTPILVRRTVFDRELVFNKVRRQNDSKGSGVILEGTLARKPVSDLDASVFVTAGAAGIYAVGEAVSNPESKSPAIPLSAETWQAPRSVPTLNWKIVLGQKSILGPDETIRFSTPNPGRITKTNGNVVTNSVQTASPLEVTLDKVITTTQPLDHGPVWSDWHSVADWLASCVWHHGYARPPENGTSARLSWTPYLNDEWMPVADRVCPNFGPPFGAQDDGQGPRTRYLRFGSIFWPEDGPYGVHILFGHFNEAGPVVLDVPMSGETPLHQSFTCGKCSVELVSIRTGTKNQYPQLVMKLRAAGLLVREDGAINSYSVPVDQPLNTGESLSTTPDGQPLIVLRQSYGKNSRPTLTRSPVGKNCFKASLPDQPVEVTCDIVTPPGAPVTLTFILMDEVRLFNFGVMPKLEEAPLYE